MRRILTMLAVVALMAAMMVASAMPAFADANHPTYGQCHKIINVLGVPLFNDTNSEFNQDFNPDTSKGNQQGTGQACIKR